MVSVRRKPVRERARTKERTPRWGVHGKYHNALINKGKEEILHTGDQKISTCLETEPADDEGCQWSEVLHSERWKELRSEETQGERTSLLVNDA